MEQGPEIIVSAAVERRYDPNSIIEANSSDLAMKGTKSRLSQPKEMVAQLVHMGKSLAMKVSGE
jgi:hypothetical protein